jgi:hypothetical protein
MRIHQQNRIEVEATVEEQDLLSNGRSFIRNNHPNTNLVREFPCLFVNLKQTQSKKITALQFIASANLA